MFALQNVGHLITPTTTRTSLIFTDPVTTFSNISRFHILLEDHYMCDMMLQNRDCALQKTLKISSKLFDLHRRCMKTEFRDLNVH
jgi:hypothetical protein